MIERTFIKQNIKEFQIKEFVKQSLGRVGLSNVKLQRTPLGEKIIVAAARPGLVVGRAGSTIQKLTRDLKAKFKLENPQIEIEEIKDISHDAAIIAENIASSLERFGTRQFKSSGYRAMRQVIDGGALGVEIILSGKIPSQRAKNWRFYQGYLKKCGDIALVGVHSAQTTALLKTGTVGVKVSIMPITTKLPDHVELLETVQTVVEEVADEEVAVAAPDKKTGSKKSDTQDKQKPVKKTPRKTEKKAPAKKTAKTTAKKSSPKKKVTEEKDESKGN